jgi:predicted nucleic acid-binding protein
LACKAIGLADSIIAATAIERDLILITGNLSQYQRILVLGYSLKLDNWRNWKHRGVRVQSLAQLERK